MFKVSSQPPPLLRVLLWIAPFSILFTLGMVWFSRPKFETYGAIQVHGSDRFCAQVIVALQLLEERSPNDFHFVEANIMRVSEHRCTGMGQDGTCRMSLMVASSSPSWCASAFAHEAYHAKLAKVPGHVYGKQDEELECIAYQRRVLEQVGGSSEEVEWLDSQDGMHFDSNGDGAYTWEDYRDRRY
jgi:hypothetical protein